MLILGLRCISTIPLHLAAFHGYLVVVRFLLDERADDDAGERSSNTPLHRKAREYPLGN